MNATSDSRPKADPASALELIAEARELLDPWDDPRAWLLDALPEVWTHSGTKRNPDPRWSVAANILGHDEPASAEDPLRYTAMRLLMRVDHQLENMVSLRCEKSDREDLQERSQKLRADADRLCSIAYAVTAVHSLGSVQS
jgi:hypothetical protein